MNPRIAGLMVTTVDSPPSITSIAPSAAAPAGGSVHTITGTAFVADATVTVDGVPATGVSVGSGTSLTFTAPAGSTGLADVVVTNPNGQTSGTSGNAKLRYSMTIATSQPSGWWKPTFTAAPWAGAASDGTSAGRNVDRHNDFVADIQASDPLNGLVGASGKKSARSGLQVRTGTWPGGAEITLNTLFNNLASWSMAALIKPTSITHATATPWIDIESSPDRILFDGNAAWGFALSTSGGNKVQLWMPNAANVIQKIDLPIALGAPILVQAKYDGTTFKARTDGGAWTNLASTYSASAGANGMRVFYHQASQPTNTDMWELVFWPRALSDDESNDVLDEIETKYALTF